MCCCCRPSTRGCYGLEVIKERIKNAEVGEKYCAVENKESGAGGGGHGVDTSGVSTPVLGWGVFVRGVGTISGSSVAW